MTPRTLHLSDGGAVRLIEAGAGAPVLLLHGVGLCADVWGPQMATLAQGHRVIAADLPGHGGSDALHGAPDLPDFVAWAARVIAALGLGPVSVVGHSMGALIAGGVAVAQPRQIARAALISAVYLRSDAARAAVQARAAEIAAGTMPVDAPFDRWFTPQETQLRAEVTVWMRGTSRAGYASAYRAFAAGDATYAAHYGEISCPFMALTGEDDPNSTPQMSRAMAAAVPSGRAVIVDGARHMVTLTAPDAVNAALQDWLSRTQVAA